ncbi:MAG: hypothetical protein ACYCWE_00435 [Eubacteriales bacterium]
MENFWKEESIIAPPVYTLAACAPLNTNIFNKDDLSDMTALTESLAECFRSALFVCNDKQLGFISDVAAMSAGKRPFTEMPLEFYPIYRNGFVYLFSWEGNDYLVLPDELAEVYHKVLSEADFTVKSKRNQEICAYANALLNLYGAYETEWLVKVWNHHHREKVTNREAEKVLSDLADFHADFYFEEDYIVHECLFEDEFDQLLEEVCEIDYYMPAKNVIAIYSARNIDYSEYVPGAVEMNAFLSDIITDEVKLDNLMSEVSISCERIEKSEDVRDYLKTAGFPLEDAKAAAKFEKLYQNLRDNTHIWELRGFTPYQYERETGKRLKRFALPAQKTKKKNPK